MKKLAVYAVGMMMALSLAACSPTKVEPTKAQTEYSPTKSRIDFK